MTQVFKSPCSFKDSRGDDDHTYKTLVIVFGELQLVDARNLLSEDHSSRDQ